MALRIEIGTGRTIVMGRGAVSLETTMGIVGALLVDLHEWPIETRGPGDDADSVLVAP